MLPRVSLGSAAPLSRSYACYLFDADGTLIDTAEMIYQCFVNTLRLFGNRSIAREEVMSGIGLPLRQQMHRYLGPMDEARYLEVRAAHMAYQKLIHERYLRAFPGVVEALRSLKKENRKLGVVTSRLRETLAPYLDKTGMLQFFDVLVTPEDTAKHKPEPEPVFKALETLAADAKDCLFVGDSVWDIECGNRAGVDTALARWGVAGSEPPQSEPTFYIDHPSQLLPR